MMKPTTEYIHSVWGKRLHSGYFSPYEEDNQTIDSLTRNKDLFILANSGINPADQSLNVVELGCGFGLMKEELECSYFGIDHDPEKKPFFCNDFETALLMIEDRSLNYIFAQESLLYSQNDNMILKLCHDVLKSGGRFIASEWFGSDLSVFHARNTRQFNTIIDFVQEVRDHGFKEILVINTSDHSGHFYQRMIEVLPESEFKTPWTKNFNQRINLINRNLLKNYICVFEKV